MKKLLAMSALLIAAGCGAQGEDIAGEANAELRGQSCGGFAGFPCPTGYACVDDPRDSCDPDRGGADCGGICVREKAPSCKPEKKYVSRNVTQCAATLFLCEVGREPFFDASGCGCACEGSVNKCDDPARTYMARDAYTCSTIRFACADGLSYFSDDCGCGCTY